MQRSILALITGSLLLGLIGAATKVQSQSLASVSTIALQGQSVSRWQEERFGPIVSTDTLWTISTYYGQKQGISIYAMMDLIVAANPRVFINGNPDRMMDGYFLTIPNLDRRASDTTTDSSEAVAGDAVVDNTAITTPDPVETAVDAAEATLSTEEMDSLRSNLAESIALIENLQRENVDLQERLSAVNSELADLKQRVDIEDAADAELRQLTDEVTAIAAAERETVEEPTGAESSPAEDATPAEEPTAVESADAEVIVDESRTDETMSEESLADVDADAGESAADDDSAATAAEPEPDVDTAAVEPMLDADEEVTKESATAASSESESSAAATIPNRGASKGQAPSFIDWLLQPYQLALAILVPLLIAAIIWYVIYVRRVNREIAGTYNGARQAAERDKQGQLAEEESPQDESDETTAIAVDDPLWSESDEESDDESDEEIDEFDIEVVESESTPEHELDEASDEDIEAALADLNWSLDDASSADAETSETAADAAGSESETDSSLDSMPDLELEQAPEPEPELESEPEPELEPEPEPEPEPHSNKEDDTASTHDVDLIDIETLLEEADAEANDDVEDRYSTDDVKEVLGESDESNVPSATDLEDDFEMGKSPATLLDLAQAYIEMGEVEDAQVLLNKIKHCGDDDIEREVAQLLQNLDGQSHR